MEKLFHLTDQLNKLHGKDFVRFASMGYEQRWAMRQQWLSQRYTTRVKELLVINMEKV